MSNRQDSPGARVERLLYRGAMALPRPLQRLLGGPPICVEAEALSPDAQLTARLTRLRPPSDLSQLSPEQARAATLRRAYVVGGAPPALAEVRELTLQGAAGPLAARLYVPEGLPAPSPLLVYYHGGGWVTGDLDSHDALCRFLAATTPLRVLSVDYRRAPEHKHPAPVDDATAAFRDAVAQAATLGADPARVAVGGDSAGGQLAAVVALDTAGATPAPACQLLIYPATDLSARSASYGLFAEGFVLSAAKMDWYIAHYLAEPEQALDPRASPLLAEDLRGLCPAIVATAGFDVLRDEGEAYAARLAEAGVPVTLRRYSGLLHTFANTVNSSADAREAVSELAALLAGVLA
ncbi:MAG: alpha/beta hydrolase [Alphaproteobacteria bacterium]|nr:alpha/beta hydrolase [Alphaproteobacteria bacterium]MCB9797796.1 alpha/beta hydrolase [Alphaproteobacteria bacterium]